MGRPIELRGDRVSVRTTSAADRAALVVIRSTSEVRAWWRGADLESEFDDDLLDEAAHQLTIEDFTGRVVGLIQFSEEEEPDYRHASIDLYLDPRVHRRGFGLDAVRTIVRYLIDDRCHHRLTIDPAADNAAAIGCYSKVGFKPVGVMRQYERRSDGSWNDGLLMELLACEFEQ